MMTDVDFSPKSVHANMKKADVSALNAEKIASNEKRCELAFLPDDLLGIIADFAGVPKFLNGVVYNSSILSYALMDEQGYLAEILLKAGDKNIYRRHKEMCDKSGATRATHHSAYETLKRSFPRMKKEGNKRPKRARSTKK